MKLIRTTNVEGNFSFYCPGCEHHHGVWTKEPNPITGKVWSFNGNLESPSFTPSLLIYEGWDKEKNIPIGKVVCHSIITDGKINYCGDCAHNLAGQTIDMIEEGVEL